MNIKEEMRKKGINKLKEGCALIDTSNRTGEVNEKDVIAIKSSKSIAYTIIFLSEEKKRIKRRLLKKGHDKGRIHSIMHSVEIYYALVNYIDQLPAIYICPEGCNKGSLENYLKQFLREKYPENKIKIQSLKSMFGKKNIAHELALRVKRNPSETNLVLKESHFEKLELL